MNFFQCYHLNEAREILWEWFTEVVSSTRNISIDGNDRSNHVYFYEKIEEVVDAAYLVNKRSQNRYLRRQERKNKRNEVRINSQRSSIEFVEDVILNKPKPLIEYVNEAPFYVITEVFKNESLACLNNNLKAWLQIALSNDSSIYEVAEHRQQLSCFHNELQLFVEALWYSVLKEPTMTL
jgi:hypothetical protein